MALAGCSDDTIIEPPPPSEDPVVASIEITPTNDTLTALGKTRQLSAIAKDASGGTIAGKTFAWSSSAPGVASVAPSSGLVTAIAEGSTTVTATVDGVSGSATVTVIQFSSTLSVQTQPADTESGVPFLVQPVVELQDANGNRVVTDISTVVSARVGTGGGTLFGTTQVTAEGGLASFADLGISGPPGERTLQFTASGFATVMSGPFSLDLGPMTSDTIGTAGGTLALADGASILVPEGAVNGEILIQFGDTSDVIPWYAGLSDRGYNVELNVLGVNTSYSLDHSIRITLPIDPAKVSGGTPYVRAVFSNLPTESFVAPAALVGNDSLVIAIPAIGLEELDITLLGDRVFLYAEEVVHESSELSPGHRSGGVGSRTRSAAGAIVGCDEYPLPRSAASKAPQPGVDVAIILVHGWNKNVADCPSFRTWQSRVFDPDPDIPGEEYFDELLPALETRLGEQYPIYVFTYPSFRSFRTSGDWLGQRVEELQQQEGFTGVILVGHSMGGLVSRQAVRFLRGLGYADLVSGVITLGTPHLGTPYPSSTWAKVFFHGVPTEGGQSLLPDSALPAEEEVAIFAYGGDISARIASTLVPSPSLFKWGVAAAKLCSSFDECESDGLVAEASALPSFIEIGRTDPVLDYTHSELHKGRNNDGEIDDPLYEAIFADIEGLVNHEKWRIAIYCETAGFDISAHEDEFEVKISIPCWNGSQFDANVSDFTASDVDVIFIGGDDTFSSSTASAIENAVYNDGKILCINFWSDSKFESSLPATKTGYANYGPAVIAGDPTNPIVAEILGGVPQYFQRSGRDYNRRSTTSKSGATVVTKFTLDNTPALLVWSYGNGKVIYHTMELVGAFYSEYSDRITYQGVKWALQ